MLGLPMGPLSSKCNFLALLFGSVFQFSSRMLLFCCMYFFEESRKYFTEEICLKYQKSITYFFTARVLCTVKSCQFSVLSPAMAGLPCQLALGKKCYWAPVYIPPSSSHLVQCTQQIIHASFKNRHKGSKSNQYCYREFTLKTALN